MANLQTGLHHGIPARVYHSDPCQEPSLSSGIARKILSDSVAHAYAKHPKLGGGASESTNSLSLGSLVHSQLDDSAEKDFVLGEFPSYTTGEARKWRDAVTASGKQPILERDLVEAAPISDAIRRKVALSGSDPFASGVRCEVTGIWKEGDTFCRARYDRLLVTGNRALVWDWKTTNNISDRGIISSISKYGYHIQVAHYSRGLAAILGIDPDNIEFDLVFVESAAPYTVRRVRLTEPFLTEGWRQSDKAIEAWAKALASGDWSDPREREVFEAIMPMYLDSDNEEITVS